MVNGTLAISINTEEIDLGDIATAIGASLAASPNSDYAPILNPKSGQHIGVWNTKGIIPSED